jgi:hypothetical protein
MNKSALPYDVFLSHSAKDRAVVCPLAKQSRAGGLQPLAFSLQPFLGSLAQFLYINWLPADREQESSTFGPSFVKAQFRDPI